MKGTLLLATDGLFKYASRDHMVAICREFKGEEAVERLVELGHFLEEHHLFTSNLVKDGNLRGGKSFELWSSDLTEEGLAVIRSGLPNWEKKLSC